MKPKPVSFRESTVNRGTFRTFTSTLTAAQAQFLTKSRVFSSQRGAITEDDDDDDDDDEDAFSLFDDFGNKHFQKG